MDSDSSAPLSISHRQQEWDKEGPEHASSSLLSRRGLRVNGLALMAPPDASPKSYTDLTPPPTAPIVTDSRFEEHITVPGHQRSASEATPYTAYRARLHHKSSRDIGIVGTGGIYSIDEGIGTTMQNEYDGLKVPIFQTPAKSRSSSPSAQTPDLSSSAATSFNESYYATPGMASSSFHTPALGESKEIGQPVVGPVVVGLNAEGVMRRQPSNPAIHISSSSSPPRHQSSPYIYYEPGVHSTAGPLPPPPRSVFEDSPTNSPPPRPPRLRTPLQLSPASSSEPKRDVEALKQSLRLPESVNAVLASRASSRVNLTRQDSVGSDASHYSDDENENLPMDNRPSRSKRNKSVHRREGAFPPSSSSTVAHTHSEQPLSLPLIDSDQNRQTSDEILPPSETIRLCTKPNSSISEGDDDVDGDQSKPKLRREPSWVSIGHESKRVTSPSILSDEVSTRRSSSRSPSIVSSIPLPPPKLESESASDAGEHMLSKAGNSLKATFSNLKRFSTLPRTPSSTNLSTVSSGLGHSLQISSPIQPVPARKSPRPKKRNRNPVSLQYQDIAGKKQASERLKLYADKINDLSRHDTGLGEWVLSMKVRGTGSRVVLNYGPVADGNGPSLPSSLTVPTQPRHTSHGSIVSEATFPIRADAYIATDLSTRASDDIPSARSPPPLPYPSLAGVVSPPRPSNRASALLLPSASLSPRSQQVTLAPSTKTGGFFASLGRKTSVKKDKDRSPGMSPTTSPQKLSKRPPNPNGNGSPPRIIRVISPPTIPGGPRAVPGKMQRAQTLSVAPRALSPEPVEPASRRNTHRASAVNRRPSLFTKSSSAPQSHSTNPDFERQVDKLADILPNADRRILAAYLRRTGQDMLAIGQYLEDEKNGTLRYD
ncbi:hypothetical protein QCA50_001283 [Cerrena zonata]|uniref:Uncharacterized protein n=1 Tax=Cerrena zonata TaxID=2478898 RepID=A0AAW0H0L9_9APHY